MELKPKEAAMLRQLLNICRSDNVDLYLDDIKSFNELRSKLNGFKYPKIKKINPLEMQKLNGTNGSKNTKKIKGKKVKYWHRRNRHKNKQQMKGDNSNDQS